MNKTKSLVAIFGLLAAFFVPAQPALSVGPSKEVLVTDENGNPVPNATVALMGLDIVNDQNSIVDSDVTNDSGVTILQWDDTTTDVPVGIAVQAASTSLSLKMEYLPDLTSDSEQTGSDGFVISLPSASMVVEAQTSNGDPAPAGTEIRFPFMETFNGTPSYYEATGIVLQPGPVGLAVSKDAISQGTNLLTVFPRKVGEQYPHPFLVDLDTNQDFLVFGETEIGPNVNNVYPLQMRPFNILGQLKTSDGSADFALPTGVTASIHIQPADVNGNPIPGRDRLATVNSDGSFLGFAEPYYFEGQTQETFVAMVMLKGDFDYPTFVSQTFVVNIDEVLNLNIPVPAAPASSNLKLRTVDDAGNPTGSFIDITQVEIPSGQEPISLTFYGPNHVPSGVAALNLPNGTYHGYISPFDNLFFGQMFVEIIVDSSGVRVFVNEQQITQTDTVFEIDPSMANGGSGGNQEQINGDILVSVTDLNGQVDPTGDVWVYEWIDGWETASEFNPDLVDPYSNGLFSVDFPLDDARYILEFRSDNPRLGYSYLDVTMVGGSLDSVSTPTGVPVVIDGDAYPVQLFATNNLLVRAISPADQSPLTSGFIDVYAIETTFERYVNNIYFNQDGEVGFELPTGTYALYVVPEGDNTLARKRYALSIDVNGDPSITGKVAGGDDFFTLESAISNVVGQVFEIDGVTPFVVNYRENIYADVILQAQDNQSLWQELDYRRLADDGTFAFSVDENNDAPLRILVRPNGRTDVAESLSTEFSLTDILASTNDVLDLDITLQGPDVLIVVRQQGSLINERHAGLEIRKNDQFVGWSSTGSSRVAGLVFEGEGDFEIIVRPSWENGEGTNKSYQANVNANGDVTITGGTAVTLDGESVIALELGVANVSGVVLSPDGSEVIRYTRITPFDSTGQPLWEQSTSTNELGSFQLSLEDAGTYTIMASGDGSELFGDSPKLGPITVDSGGNATFGGSEATGLELRLSPATWSGTVVEPGTSDPLANASVCIQFDDQSYFPSCAWTGDNGVWSLSAPEGSSGFTQFSSLRIEEFQTGIFTPAEYRGKEAIEATLTAGIDGTYSWPEGYSYDPADTNKPRFENIELSPLPANFTVSVTDPDGNAVTTGWVSAFNDILGYIGGNQLNIDGEANLNIPNDVDLSTVKLSVQLFGDASLEVASVEEFIDVATNSTTLTVTSYSLQLPASNFKGRLFYPSGQTDADAAQYTYIEVYDMATGEWLPSINVGQNGNFSASLKSGTAAKTYKLTARPPWDATQDASEGIYTVTVQTDGAIAVDDILDDPVSPTTGDNPTFFLSLSDPNVAGTVVDPNGNPVRDSRVEIYDFSSRMGLWDKTAFSKRNGSFSLNLADGVYDVFADKPWNSSDMARSAFCMLDIVSGALTSSSESCVQTDGSVLLQLREPNLKLTLEAPDGSPAAYANFGISAGNWNYWTQADSQGRVSAFVDFDEINRLNPDWDPANEGLTVRTYFDPAWGSSGMVRFECLSGVVETGCPTNLPSLTSDSSVSDVWNNGGETLNLGTIRFPEPNTSFQVTYPAVDGAQAGEPVEQGAWVSVYIHDNEDDPNWMTWVGGSNTDANGFVAFDLPDTTGATEYTFEVNAPWDRRTGFASKMHRVNYADILTHDFDLQTPNVQLEILDTGGSAANWSWVAVEVVDGANRSWYQGFSANRFGEVSMSLQPNQNYRVEIHPGPYSDGARTVCNVSVNSDQEATFTGCTAVEVSGVVKVSLTAGNFAGQIKVDDSQAGVLNDTPLEGAIAVFTSGSETIQAIADASGNFIVNLDDGTWTVGLYYFPNQGEFDPDSVVNALQVVVSGGVATVAGSGHNINTPEVLLIGDGNGILR